MAWGCLPSYLDAISLLETKQGLSICHHQALWDLGVACQVEDGDQHEFGVNFLTLGYLSELIVYPICHRDRHTSLELG
jgi:hypothetical protein